MKKIYVLILVLCYTLGHAQEPCKELNAFITGGGSIKFFDKDCFEFDKTEGENLVLANKPAGQLYTKAKKQNVKSNIFGGASVGILVGGLLAYSADKKSTSYYLIAPFVGSFTYALINLKRGKKNLRQAMEIYNSSAVGGAPYPHKDAYILQLASTESGLGLVYTF